MTIVKGLKNINALVDKPKYDENSPKVRWLKLAVGQSAKIRFIEELDEDSAHYSADRGLALVVKEHTNPKDYKRKGLCTNDDQGKCWGCEQHRKDYKAGWKGRSRLYINVLVDDGKEDPYVAILSQGSSGKTIAPTLIEYAGEMGSISNLMWRMKRTGSKTDTSYTIIPLQKDETPFDFAAITLYELEM